MAMKQTFYLVLVVVTAFQCSLLRHSRQRNLLTARTSHSRLSPEDRRALGISDGLVRVSVGLEHASDLIADFDQALKNLSGIPNS